MFANGRSIWRWLSAAVLVTSVLTGCGSHVGAEGTGDTTGDSSLRDPDNPYWKDRPLNFDWVDPAQGPGMR